MINANLYLEIDMFYPRITSITNVLFLFLPKSRGQTGGMTDLDVWARWSKAHQGYGVQSKVEVLSSYNGSALSTHTSSNGHALTESSKVYRCNNIQEIEEVIPSMDRMRYHLQVLLVEIV